MNKRLPPLVAGVVGFVVCIVIFWIEGASFVGIRSKDFRYASTGELVTANEGNGQCVSYIEPKLFKEYYVDAKFGITYPFAFPVGYGGEDVKCDTEETREALGLVLAASVHAIEYNFQTAAGSASDELTHARAGAVASALGLNGETNWTNAVETLRSLEKPPTTCEEIYVGATEAVVYPEPQKRVQIACYDAPIANFVYDADRLYSHCLQQFAIGRFGAQYDSWSWGWYRFTGGSLGLPVYGDVLKPALESYSDPPGYNSSSPWTARTRIMTGMRYGWSVFGTVPVILLTTFLMVDCVFFLIVELTLHERIKGNADAVDATGGGTRSMFYSMLIIYATSKATRSERFFFTFLGWVCVILFRALYSWAPFNFGKILPRPNCKSGTGWETDEGTVALEWTSVWLLFFVIVALPLSKSSWFSINHMTAFRGNDSVDDDDFSLNITRGARRTRKFVGLVLLGLTICLIGQAFAAILFGEAWAEAVTIPPKTGVKFTDADAYAEVVYTKAVGAYALAMTGGAAMAAVLGRWLFGGRSWCSCLVLFLWLLLALGSLLPMLMVDNLTLDRDEFNKECSEAFAGDDDDMEDKRGRCNLRYWAYVIGLIVIFIPLALMLFYCIFRNALTFCLARSRGGVDKEDPVYADAKGEIQSGELMEAGSVMPAEKYVGDQLPLLRMSTLKRPPREW